MDANTSRMVNLNGSNYHVWKGKMEDLLYVKDYYLPVFSTDKPDNKTDEEWSILHRKVCRYVRQWVDDNVLNHISGETHARTLWNKLEELYAHKTENNKLFLIKQLINLKYRDGTPDTDHLNVFQGVINQLAGMGIKFEDEIQGLWLLGTLPDSWETFRTSLSNSAANGIITMELAKGSILNEEMRRKSEGSSSHSDVLVTESRGEVKVKVRVTKGSIVASQEEKMMILSAIIVAEKGIQSETNTTTDEFFICCDYDMVNVAHDDSSWVVDSGATCHVTSQRDFYTSYTPGDFGSVKMGNSGLSKIVGVGDICLKFDTGMELVLHNVKHVPDIRLNLISAGTLDEDGYHNSFGDGNWKLTRGSLIVARGKRASKLYTTHPKISKDSVHSLVNTDMTELWHKRLGHMSEKGMSLLLKRNALSGVRDVHLKKCSHCLEGKQNRVTFKSHSPSRKERILDLVHSDVCGPMKTRSLGGCSYFVTFIDDHSRKVWVYSLKSKDQVFDVFKQFHALVERQTGKKFKCIRTDNGGEYIGPFDAYCREKGIRHQKSPPKTPQLNGLAEQINRTLAERVRSFVHIPKDERSKLDVKTRPFIFLGYGQDEFGYRLYDPVLKKLVRSRDVFMEDQTLKDIKKVQAVPQYSDDLIELDPVPPQHSEPQSGDETQVDQQHENGDIVNPELPIPDMPAFIPLRWSTRDRHPSTRFSADEYVLLTDGGEPECYAEAMEDEYKRE
ncbi:hypothetical protein E3N88_29141 [Mikania micrantha]|uniref:Integrase catalytic domain-containing protein n=1 Tax=Mikania micrantha TaxID=192012 RepID=A0A5N6N2Q3_9ASTR|nr:hypothetical protein E3N88_29141 [Mikania micrantha]